MKRLTVAVLLILVIGVSAQLYAQSHYQGCHINTGVAKVCRVGAGVFYAVTINFKGASGNYTYIWDLASTDKITSTTPVMVIDTTGGPLTLTYNMMMVNGVTVWDISGTIADITVLTE